MTRPTSLGQTSPSTAELGPFLNSAADNPPANIATQALAGDSKFRILESRAYKELRNGKHTKNSDCNRRLARHRSRCCESFSGSGLQRGCELAKHYQSKSVPTEGRAAKFIGRRCGTRCGSGAQGGSPRSKGFSYR